MSKHTISVLVENHSGALSRISGLFSARGFNISSLSVAETDDPTLSRMTIVVSGDNKEIDQITKQLNKLIDVVKVLDFSENERVERELMLLTVNVTAAKRHEIVGIVQIFHGFVLAVSQNEMTIELSETADRLLSFIDLLRPYGIKEIARSGPIALSRARL
ncbi:MAG: acetolactate synthase small subunit [Chitinispirillales bacterium]|jgi:acetolactate synthase-1/3 small subunit|nr:acetolactate synthase small subunit [Chitinispirillales bacterium]